MILTSLSDLSSKKKRNTEFTALSWMIYKSQFEFVAALNGYTNLLMNTYISTAQLWICFRTRRLIPTSQQSGLWSLGMVSMHHHQLGIWSQNFKSRPFKTFGSTERISGRTCCSIFRRWIQSSSSKALVNTTDPSCNH